MTGTREAYGCRFRAGDHLHPRVAVKGAPAGRHYVIELRPTLDNHPRAQGPPAIGNDAHLSDQLPSSDSGSARCASALDRSM